MILSDFGVNMLYIFTSLFLVLSFSSAQDIITVLSQQKSVSRFTDILREYPSIVQDLNNGRNTGWFIDCQEL